MILLDSDHLTVVIDRRSKAHAALLARLDDADEFLGVPVVCVEEQCKGWLAKIHSTRDIHDQIPAYDRLKRLFEFFRSGTSSRWKPPRPTPLSDCAGRSPHRHAGSENRRHRARTRRLALVR